MNPTKLKHFRELIQARISSLLDEIAVGHAATATVQLDQQMVGRLSRMDAIQQQAMAKAANQRREGEVQRLKAALLRIDEDEFGYCEDCGEDIEHKRLEISPTTTRCMPCLSG